MTKEILDEKVNLKAYQTYWIGGKSPMPFIFSFIKRHENVFMLLWQQSQITQISVASWESCFQIAEVHSQAQAEFFD